MYKSILMNLDVFPIFIFSSPNLILKILKIVSKNFFGALLWSKIVNWKFTTIWSYRLITEYKTSRKYVKTFVFWTSLSRFDQKFFWLLITCQKWLFFEIFPENRLLTASSSSLKLETYFKRFYVIFYIW